MATKVYIARLSSYSAENLRSDYEKIKERFISVDGGRVSERNENILGRELLHKAFDHCHDILLGNEGKFLTPRFYLSKKLIGLGVVVVHRPRPHRTVGLIIVCLAS